MTGKTGSTDSNITNCYNIGTVYGANVSEVNVCMTGGIVGGTYKGVISIINCYNQGTTSATSLTDKTYGLTGGIVGKIYDATTVINCYNTGSTNTPETQTYRGVGGIVGQLYASSGSTSLCYWLNTIATEGVYFVEIGTTYETTSMTESEMKASAFVDTLNTNITKTQSEVTLLTWTQTDTYPTFEEDLSFTLDININVNINVNVNTNVNAGITLTPTTATPSVTTIMIQDPRKQAVATTNIEITGKEEITLPKEEVTYNIKYTGEIENHTGTGIITIVETLPYEIDTTKSYDLDGGTYDETNKTITWTKTYNIDTYTDSTSGQIEIEISPSFVYNGVNNVNTKFTNSVSETTQLKDESGTETTQSTSIASINITYNEMQIPITGGIGIVEIRLMGIVLIAIGLVVINKKRRKNLVRIFTKSP